MASLQARHSRTCAGGRPWTTFKNAKKGCNCVPLYHVVLRHNGAIVREPVGHNRTEAERALDARRGDVARRQYRIVEDIAFDEWGDEWLASLTGKQNSIRTYATTIDYAKRVFGKTKLRELAASDVRRFLDTIRQTNMNRTRWTATGVEPSPREASPATLAKHLRQLGACFEAAIAEGYAADNPVRRLHKSARPKVQKTKPAYYTGDELARLWPELAERPVFLAMCRLAVTTGLRFGELAALRWSDVDLLERELHVARTFTVGIGETLPKSGEARTVDLTPQAAAVLEGWLVEGHGGDDGLVFEREVGGHMTSNYMLGHVLYPALARAGIPRVGERGRKRDFHSFRHTFARIALENSARIEWVQKQLGHSSITLTVDTYGGWARTAEKAQAAELEGAFPV